LLQAGVLVQISAEQAFGPAENLMLLTRDRPVPAPTIRPRFDPVPVSAEFYVSIGDFLQMIEQISKNDECGRS